MEKTHCQGLVWFTRVHIYLLNIIKSAAHFNIVSGYINTRNYVLLVGLIKSSAASGLLFLCCCFYFRFFLLLLFLLLLLLFCFVFVVVVFCFCCCCCCWGWGGGGGGFIFYKHTAEKAVHVPVMYLQCYK